MWVEWVEGARRGDAAAREELVNYFTPFVHGVLVTHVAVHTANAEVGPTLDDALARINETRSPAEFGPWLLERVRQRAAGLARTPSSTLELPTAGSTLLDGKKVLSRLRQLPEPTRERLVLRLLEGITGAEIAEVSGAAEHEVRGDLERGIAKLVKELSGLSITATGDSYLWSLIGAPHTAIVPLENQLTPLRYDPAAPDQADSAGSGISPDDTPVRGPGAYSERKVEGRRPTSPELKAVKPILDDDPGTTPIGVKLVEEPTGGGVDPSAQEPTRNATDLPIAAQENPFAAQPGTLQASDLPVAAHAAPPQERQHKPRRTHEELRAGPAEAAPASPRSSAPPDVTRQRSRTGEVPATVKRDPPIAPMLPKLEDPDTTAPRGVPLSVLAAPSYEAPSSEMPAGGADVGQDWRTSVADVRPSAPRHHHAKPQPFSVMRGATPLVMAGAFFCFAAFITYILVTNSEKKARAGWTLVPVIVAAQNIPEGTTVDFSMLSTRTVPEQFVTSSVVKPDSASYVVSQRIMVPVQAGDPLLWSQFETSHVNERLSTKVQKRARAFTIEAQAVTSVGGWVRPGDHVDLIVSARDEQKKERTASIRLQNVIVLATGKITQTTNTGMLRPSQQEYGNVSVLALPEEIELLALMRERATYRMLLRNDEDVDVVEDRLGAGPSTLLNGERVGLLGKKRAQTIQTIRGSAPPASAPKR